MLIYTACFLLMYGLCSGYEGDEDDTVLPWEQSAGSDYTMVDSEYRGWKGQVVPVKLDTETLSSLERIHILKVFQQLNRKIKCITFEPYVGQKPFLFIKKIPEDPWKSATTYFRDPDGSGNSLMVLRFKQAVDDPFLNMVLKHEALHVIGLGHTIRRSDRDDYITVNWDNIPKKKHSQYEKCDDCDNMGIPYDCRSIMHYRDCRYGIPCDNPVMTAKDPEKCDLKSINYDLTESDVLYARQANCGYTKVDKDNYNLSEEQNNKHTRITKKGNNLKWKNKKKKLIKEEIANDLDIIAELTKPATGLGEKDRLQKQSGWEDWDGYKKHYGKQDSDGYKTHYGMEGSDGYKTHYGMEGSDGYKTHYGMEGSDGYKTHYGMEGSDGYKTYYGGKDRDGYKEHSGYGYKNGYKEPKEFWDKEEFKKDTRFLFSKLQKPYLDDRSKGFMETGRFDGFEANDNQWSYQPFRATHLGGVTPERKRISF